MKQKRKDFTIIKWIIFPLNSIILAGVVSYFNLSVFGYRDGLPYTLIVCLIGVFSILINKYTESENSKLARAAFVFEIILTLVLITNATYSISVQRKMSVAKMTGEAHTQTIEQIGKLKGARTQREALQHLEQTPSAQTVFSDNENILFLIMAVELTLYGLASFTLFAIAKLIDDDDQEETATISNSGKRAAGELRKAQDVVSDRAEDFPPEIYAGVSQDNRSGRRLSQTTKSDSARQWLSVAPEAFDRKAARKKLLEHLKIISHYHPGRWFKADLIEGGVHVRMCARVNGLEETIAETMQSNNLLKAVDRPDFRERLLDELVRKNFPITKDKAIDCKEEQ